VVDKNGKPVKPCEGWFPVIKEPWRGKIMRRVLKAGELGMDPGDISTLEDDENHPSFQHFFPATFRLPENPG
jgi:hypothetical protein